MTLLANTSIKQSDFVLFFSNIQPCYGKLIKPKFADGVKVNCERVITMAGQGAVYIRSKFALTEEDEDDNGEALHVTFDTCPHCNYSSVLLKCH